MAKRAGTNRDSKARGVTDQAKPFCRMLVATDQSQAARAAVALVAEWVDGPGADARFVQVTEERRHGPSGGALASDPDRSAHRLVVRAPSLGARNRQLVRCIATAAEEFAADVIVLGFDRSRLAGHRLAPSLREQLMRATDLPVLVAPNPDRDGNAHNRRSSDLGHDTERGYAHV